MEIFPTSLLPFPMVQARRPDPLPKICDPSRGEGSFSGHPHPLTLIESYSYKKRRKGVGSQHPSLFYPGEKYRTQSSARNLNPFKRLLHPGRAEGSAAPRRRLTHRTRITGQVFSALLFLRFASLPRVKQGVPNEP